MSVQKLQHENIAITVVQEIFGSDAVPARISIGCSGECSISPTTPEFDRAILILARHKFVLIGLFCSECPDGSGHMLRYVFEHRDNLLVLVRHIAGKQAMSVATIFPSATWPERECRDLFGIRFGGAFDTRRLVLHEEYPEGFHPLEKSCPNIPVTPINATDTYQFRMVSGEGVYQVPVGPVHAGIIEPGHFRFSVIGETVFNLEIRLFYTHRGIEKLAEGKNPADCMKIAEAVSGDESAANATGFCMAVERLSDIMVPDRAWHLRTVFCESERICSHLGDLAGMLTDVAFPLGASQFAVLREEMYRENEKISGSRFLRGMICPGGVMQDIPDGTLAGFKDYLVRFKKQFRIGLSIRTFDDIGDRQVRANRYYQKATACATQYHRAGRTCIGRGTGCAGVTIRTASMTGLFLRSIF